MKEQTMWMLWYAILGGLPLMVAAVVIKELLMEHRAQIHQRKKKLGGGEHGDDVQNR